METGTRLIVAHEATSQGFGRDQPAPMTKAAKTALGRKDLHAAADKGCFSSAGILACHTVGNTTAVPRPEASGNRSKGMFVKAGFACGASKDVYHCPASQVLSYRYTREENGWPIRRYWTGRCGHCPIKRRGTTGEERMISRWEHAPLIDQMLPRLGGAHDPMKPRRSTVEYSFGTIKAWMGMAHFLTRRFKCVRTEMALNVLACNMKRMIALTGVAG